MSLSRVSPKKVLPPLARARLKSIKALWLESNLIYRLLFLVCMCRCAPELTQPTLTIDATKEWHTLIKSAITIDHQIRSIMIATHTPMATQVTVMAWIRTALFLEGIKGKLSNTQPCVWAYLWDKVMIVLTSFNSTNCHCARGAHS